MKSFRNRGWRWLRYMEKILPVAGATGAHSYVATEANPPSLAGDQDQEFDHPSPQAPPDNNTMDIDSISQHEFSTSTSASIPPPLTSCYSQPPNDHA